MKGDSSQSSEDSDCRFDPDFMDLERASSWVAGTSLTVDVGVSRTRFSKTVADKAHSRLRLCFAFAKNDRKTPNISSTICVLQFFASRTCANHCACWIRQFAFFMRIWCSGRVDNGCPSINVFTNKLPIPIVSSCGYEFGILQSDFIGCQINFRTALRQDETGNPAFKPVSLFYCSALVWNIHLCIIALFALPMFWLVLNRLLTRQPANLPWKFEKRKGTILQEKDDRPEPCHASKPDDMGISIHSPVFWRHAPDIDRVEFSFSGFDESTALHCNLLAQPHNVEIGGKTGTWVEPTKPTKEGFVSSIGCQWCWLVPGCGGWYL